ncbi:MAG TPA: glycosyltransferase family 1 protein [Acidimicrobiales bacterium]|nr:glycosyltransferase family 1 protein [Acidimicrobiales bacterium]
MRVAINVEQLFYRAPGGTGRYTARLAACIAAQFSGDVVLPFCAWHSRRQIGEVLARAGLGEPRLDRPVRFPLPRPFLFDSWHLGGSLAGRLLGPEAMSARLRGADIVHMPFPVVPQMAKPLVVTVHDAGFALYPEAYPPRGLRFHRRGLEMAAARAGLVITDTRAAADEILAHSAIRPDQMRVVHLGVDHIGADPRRTDEVLHRYGLSGGPYVLWVGSLEPRKNVGVLVKAFVKLAKANKVSARLAMVGPLGWLHEGLVAEADKALLGERLLVLGEVSDEELRCLYAGASSLAVPSLHEGFGFPVLEAMAQGTPVVCSDIAALAEVSGGAAILVPPPDVDRWATSLEEVLSDPALRARLAEAGRERAEQFSWEKMATGTHAVYEELLGMST